MKKSENYTVDPIQGEQTWCDITIYNGKTYPLRVLKDKDGKELLIAGDVLDNDIHPGEWEDKHNGFDPKNPKEAKRVYDKIFFFTDNTTLNDNDIKLREEMRENNPDRF